MKPSELLADPKFWTKGAYARDNKGQTCDVRSPEAVCWCMVGAAMRCYGAAYQTAIERLYARAFSVWQYYCSFTVWQDRPARTHAEVLAFLKEAGA
jgi:hypothetical protein